MELFIYDVIEPGSARQVQQQLSAIQSDEITVRINSPGGDVFEGLAIYNALKAHPARIVVQIDGLAASMASVIAMAGDEINAAENSMLMIHDPWSSLTGTADEFAKTAETLTKIEAQLLSIYVTRTGQTEDQIQEWMQAETWFEASEAKQAGFLDNVLTVPAIAARFDLSRFENVPQKLATTRIDKESSESMRGPMEAEKTETPAEQATETKAETKPEAAVGTKRVSAKAVRAYVEKQVAERVAKTRETERSIRNLCKQHELDEQAENIIEECPTIELARTKVLDLIAERQPKTEPSIRITADEKTKKTNAIKSAFILNALQRTNASEDRIKSVFPDCDREAAEYYKRPGIRATARLWLEENGTDTRFLDDTTVAKAVLGVQASSGYHVPGDFTSDILLDAINKTLLAGYETAPITWRQWAAQGNSVSDLKEYHRIRLSEVGYLDAWDGYNKPNRLTLNGQKVSGRVGLFRDLISFDYQSIVNDDMDAFSTVPFAMGDAAGATEDQRVYELLESNPTMPYDSTALFHTDHGNLDGSGAAPTVAEMGATNALLRQQTGLNGRILNLTGDVIIVPAELDYTARQLVTSTVDPALANNASNPTNGLRVVTSPLLTDAAAWYLAARPVRVQHMEVTFRSGAESPQVSDWFDNETKAYMIDVLHEFSALFLDHRGIVKNPGT